MNESEFNIENKRLQMRKGILEYCVLLAISGGETYASDILTELKEHELIVVEGTLYPLLSRLKNEELLEYDWQESKAGPPRKYYRLTAKGKGVLEKLTQTWKELSASIISLIKKNKK